MQKQRRIVAAQQSAGVRSLLSTAAPGGELGGHTTKGF